MFYKKHNYLNASCYWAEMKPLIQDLQRPICPHQRKTNPGCSTGTLPTYVVGVWGAADGGGCRCSTLHWSASHQLVNLSSVPSITLVVFHVLRKFLKK